MKSRPSKRDVMNALYNVLTDPNWELHEYGPDKLGWYHARVEIEDGLANIHTCAKSRYEMRRRMIETAHCFVGRS